MSTCEQILPCMRHKSCTMKAVPRLPWEFNMENGMMFKRCCHSQPQSVINTVSRCRQPTCVRNELIYGSHVRQWHIKWLPDCSRRERDCIAFRKVFRIRTYFVTGFQSRKSSLQGLTPNFLCHQFPAGNGHGCTQRMCGNPLGKI